MNTIEKTHKLVQRYGGVHIEDPQTGMVRFTVNGGYRFIAATLEEAVNEAYAAMFPEVKVEPGDLVEITHEGYSYAFAIVNEDGTFSELHRVLSKTDLERLRFEPENWTVNRIIIKGPLPEPIEVTE